MTSDVSAINEIRQAATESFKNGDFETFLSYFADDAIWMPTDEPPVVGKDAFREWGQVFAGVDRPVHFTTSEEIVVDRDWAFDRFALTTSARSAGTGEVDEFVIQGLWLLNKQKDGSWKIARYIWNFND